MQRNRKQFHVQEKHFISRAFIVGLSVSGKNCLLLNFHLRMNDWEIYIKTKIPPEENSQIERKEVGEEIKELNECENLLMFLWWFRFIIGRK